MITEYPIDEMVKEIRSISKSAEKLKKLSKGIEAVDRNIDRILASIRILEINISDVADISPKADQDEKKDINS